MSDSDVKNPELAIEYIFKHGKQSVEYSLLLCLRAFITPQRNLIAGKFSVVYHEACAIWS